MRSYMHSLAGVDVVEREGVNGGAGTGSYRLTAAGTDLLDVLRTLAAWLARAPDGEMMLASTEARQAVRALTDGWSSGMVRALAARPMALTELDSIIAAVSYPSLERRLTSMRLLGMVQAAPSSGRSTPYTVTPWLRGAMAPLLAATLWEHRHWPRQAPPIAPRDIEAAFLLALPLLRLPPDASGSCRLAVRMDKRDDADGLVGVRAELQNGRFVSCVTSLEGKVDAWAHGAPGAWVAALEGGDPKRLELRDKAGLARNLIEAMHRGLQPT